MALGAIVDTVAGRSYTIELLASATAANGIPSGASAGIEWNAAKFGDSARIAVNSTAGSGTMTVAVRLWQYSGTVWFVNTALAANPASPYTAGTIPESSTDAISY